MEKLSKTVSSLKNELKELSEFLSESEYSDITVESSTEDQFQKLLDFRLNRINDLITKSRDLLIKEKNNEIEFKKCRNYIIGLEETKKQTGEGNSSDNIISYVIVCIENLKPATWDNRNNLRAAIHRLSQLVELYNKKCKEYSFDDLLISNQLEVILKSNKKIQIPEEVSKMFLDEILIWAEEAKKILNN